MAPIARGVPSVQACAVPYMRRCPLPRLIVFRPPPPRANRLVLGEALAGGVKLVRVHLDACPGSGLLPQTAASRPPPGCSNGVAVRRKAVRARIDAAPRTGLLSRARAARPCCRAYAGLDAVVLRVPLSVRALEGCWRVGLLGDLRRGSVRALEGLQHLRPTAGSLRGPLPVHAVRGRRREVVAARLPVVRAALRSGPGPGEVRFLRRCLRNAASARIGRHLPARLPRAA